MPVQFPKPVWRLALSFESTFEAAQREADRRAATRSSVETQGISFDEERGRAKGGRLSQGKIYIF